MNPSVARRQKACPGILVWLVTSYQQASDHPEVRTMDPAPDSLIAHVCVFKVYTNYLLHACLLGIGRSSLFGAPRRRLLPIHWS